MDHVPQANIGRLSMYMISRWAEYRIRRGNAFAGTPKGLTSDLRASKRCAATEKRRVLLILSIPQVLVLIPE